MSMRYRLLFHPLFLSSLLILILNDWWFKAAYPGWLTGKLSDFSGLLVFAVFVCVITGRRALSTRAVALLHVGVGVAFVLWKLAPVEIVLTYIEGTLSLPMPTRVKDASDLWALAVLPLSYRLVAQSRACTSALHILPRLRQLATVSILAVCCFSIMATSYMNRYKPTQDEEIRAKKESADVLKTSIAFLEELGCTVDQDIDFVKRGFIVHFEWPLSEILEQECRCCRGTLDLREKNGVWKPKIVLSTVNSWCDEAEVSRIIDEQLLLPLKERLEE